MRELLRAARAGHPLAITPDGPQGPREVMKVGTAILASRSALPVVPIGVGISRAWRMSSWDRFTIPHPFARVHLDYGEPIHVPRDVDESGLEEFRQRMQAGMDEVTARAREAAGDTSTAGEGS